jgi:hypothetical protein
MYLGRALAALALVGGVAISVVVPASAASAAGLCGAGSTVVSPDGGSAVCFNPTGEHLWVCDNASDGHHPGAWYRVNSDANHQVDYDLGFGNCHDVNLDTVESATVHYQACNYEGSVELNCSAWVSYSAEG